MKKHLHFAIDKMDNIIFHNVINSDNELLGNIYYFKKWKCYIWEQNDGIVMSLSCLLELTDYMKKLEANKKYGKF